MADSVEELEALNKRIEKYYEKLRGKDSGEDDIQIKAQLGSLEYLLKNAKYQMQFLSSGSSNFSDEKDMSLEDISQNTIAITRFLDFLSTEEQQNYFSMYLSCKQFKTKARYLINNNCAEKSCDVAVKEINFIDERNSEIEIVKELGVSLCNSFLNNLPSLTEDICKDALRNLTSQPGPPDPDIFDEIEDHLKEILNSEKFLPSFKRSVYFRKTLDEIELSRNNSMSDDSISIKSTCSNDISTIDDPTTMDINDPYSCLRTETSKEYDNNVDLSNDIYEAKIKSSNLINNSYVMYTIEVSAYSPTKKRNRIWETKRRYSQFDEVNTCILDQVGRLPGLKLPGKSNLRVVTKEFLENRKADLNEYLRVICLPELHKKFPKLRLIVMEFLEDSPWEKKKFNSKLGNIVNPFKNVGNAVMSVPDNILDGFNKILNQKKPDSINQSQQLSNNEVSIHLDDTGVDIGSQKSHEPMPTSLLFNVTWRKMSMHEESDDNFHIRTLFMLADETFDLQHKSLSMRRSILSLFQHLARAFFGNRVHNMVLQKVHSFLNVQQISLLLGQVTASLFPVVGKEKSVPVSVNRDEFTKARTKTMARAILFSLFTEDLSQFLGNEPTTRGILRTFNMLQDPKLNRRLAHCLIEAVIRYLLRSTTDKIDDFFLAELNPGLSNRLKTTT